MSVTETIPPEIRAEVEARALFDAVRRGDFSAAAQAQERLKELGWHLTRELPKAPRSRRTLQIHGGAHGD
jgi:hypothetical protein